MCRLMTGQRTKGRIRPIVFKPNCALLCYRYKNTYLKLKFYTMQKSAKQLWFKSTSFFLKNYSVNILYNQDTSERSECGRHECRFLPSVPSVILSPTAHDGALSWARVPVRFTGPVKAQSLAKIVTWRRRASRRRATDRSRDPQ